MADHELAMLPVRERSEASAEVRVYPAPYSRPVEALTTRFSVFSVDEYLAMGPRLVRAADAPLTARATVETGSAYGIAVPYRPSDYVFRTVEPLMRWVPDDDSLQIRQNGTVSQWYALPSSSRSETLRCIGDARPLFDAAASVPQYVYRSSNGLVGVQAVALGTGGSISMPLEIGPSDARTVCVVGAFDVSATRVSPVVSMGTTGETRIVLGIDVDDTVVLIVDSEVAGSIRNPFKPGTLAAAMLSVDSGEVRAGVWTTDGYSATMRAAIGMMGSPFVDTASIAAGDRRFVIVEAFVMGRADSAALRGQVSETMSYYATRRPR